MVNEAGWGRSSRGDSTGQDGCRSSLLGHPARSLFRTRDAKTGKRLWKLPEPWTPRTATTGPVIGNQSVTHVPG